MNQTLLIFSVQVQSSKRNPTQNTKKSFFTNITNVACVHIESMLFVPKCIDQGVQGTSERK